MSLRQRANTAQTFTQSRYNTDGIGERLREARLARTLTLTALAKVSGVPTSTISKIENGQLRPSLVHAINLANALEKNLGFLIDRYRNSPQARMVIRAGRRDRLEFGEMGLTLEDLSGHFDRGILEARLGVLEPGAHSGIEPMSHPGDEFCYVIEGAIRYRVEEQIIELNTGEYMQFRCDQRHSWENAHRSLTRVLWVFSDGTISF